MALAGLANRNPRVGMLGCGDASLSLSGPIGPDDFAILGIFFMTCELEICCAGVAHIHGDDEHREVTWRLPASKNDPRAIGTSRTWGCVCEDDGKLPCLFHAMKRQLPSHRSRGVPVCSLPLFPTSAGEEIDKDKAVDTIVAFARAYGAPVTDSLVRSIFGWPFIAYGQSRGPLQCRIRRHSY